MLQHEHHLLKKYIIFESAIWWNTSTKGKDVSHKWLHQIHTSINKDYTIQIGKKTVKIASDTPL